MKIDPCLLAALVLPLALMGGCRSGPPRGDPGAVDIPVPEPLVGMARLAGESIEVEAIVNAGGMRPAGARPDGAPRSARGGGGGFAMGGGMGGPPGGGMGGRQPAMAEAPGGGGPPSTRPGSAMGAGGPSHTLSIVFTNVSPETVEFTIVEVKSKLGNFVPKPETLALAPGQVGRLYPMRGSLPMDVRTLELTVAIRTTDGTQHSRVILMEANEGVGEAQGR